MYFYDFYEKISNNCTVISCIGAKCSSQTTDVLMVILQHLFCRKNKILIEYTNENVKFFMIFMKNFQ